MNKYKIGFYILLICFIATISFVIVNFSYAADENTSTIYSRDELSELLKNQTEELEITGDLFNSNNYAFSIYIDNVKATSLNSNARYNLESYLCDSGTTKYNETSNFLKWDNKNQNITINNNVNSLFSCTLNFKSYNNYSQTLSEKIVADNTVLPSRTNFSAVFLENTTGKMYYTDVNTENVCKTNNILTYVSGSGTSSKCKTYFFAGNTNNNYVLFGNFLWRIIRINEDQSVRLILQKNYVDYSALGTGAIGYSIIGVPYAAGCGINEYLGYKTPRVETASYAAATTGTYESGALYNLYYWVNNTKIINYYNYISKTAIYCNDRSIFSGLGYGNNATIYGAYNRLVTNKNPQYKCPQVNDRFTVSKESSNGIANYSNGSLSFGIGMITADELAYSGKVYNIAGENYIDGEYTTHSSLHTMTPHSFSTYAYIFRNDVSNKAMNYYSTSTTTAIRAVLSLKSCVKYLKGNGTEANPYEVIIDGTCEAAIN